MTIYSGSTVHKRMRRAFTHVTAFVDWQSQLLITGVNAQAEPLLAARAALKQVTRRITLCLSKIEKKAKFRVALRLYHGWRKGYEPTTNFKAIRQVISETDFSSLSNFPNISYSGIIGFGDCLISASPKRLHPKISIHLPNTYRDRGDRGSEEKMVDTAIATDSIVCAYQYPEDWIILVGEDDDLVPPLFSIETIVCARGAKALLLSKRKRSNNFLLLDGLNIQ